METIELRFKEAERSRSLDEWQRLEEALDFEKYLMSQRKSLLASFWGFFKRKLYIK